MPAGTYAAQIIVTIQHWHNLGLLSASFTPRPCYSARGEDELLADLRDLRPHPGQDVQLPMAVHFKGRVLGRVRMGHVLFADCGRVKVMCKEQRLQSSFQVVVNELRVGDTLCHGL